MLARAGCSDQEQQPRLAELGTQSANSLWQSAQPASAADVAARGLAAHGFVQPASAADGAARRLAAHGFAARSEFATARHTWGCCRLLRSQFKIAGGCSARRTIRAMARAGWAPTPTSIPLPRHIRNRHSHSSQDKGTPAMDGGLCDSCQSEDDNSTRSGPQGGELHRRRLGSRSGHQGGEFSDRAACSRQHVNL